MHTLMLLTMSLSAVTPLEDGSLLVWQHSNKPVAQVTGSSITHVAIVLHRGEDAWVYEATPAQVRCLMLAEYCREVGDLLGRDQRPTHVSVLEPKYPYSDLQVERMRLHAVSQIGRRYSVKGYVRHQKVDGIHCAQLVASTLAAGGRFEFEESYGISPGELVASVSASYKPPVTLTVEPTAARGT